MKVLQFFAESFNREDTLGLDLADLGFVSFCVNGRPAVCSADALWALQCGEPYGWRRGAKLFETESHFLARQVPTRVLATPWPDWIGIENLDPHAKALNNIKWHTAKPLEPESRLFETLLELLQSPNDTKHLLYFSVLGHVGLRLGHENLGIPSTTPMTFARLLTIFRELVWPVIDKKNTIVLFMPDHGTRREGVDFDKSIFNTFLWAYDPLNRWRELNRDVTWADIRMTLCELWNIDPSVIHTEGESLLCF